MASSSSPSPLSLGWCCIIETLADSKQAELPLLKELIKRVPDFYTAAPESVRERVALRYLEECASRGMVDAKNISGATVDISQSTEDFLSQNLKRPIDPSEPSQSRIVPISDDIRQFISQKRSVLPKLSLDLLKESVLGTNAKLPSTRQDGSFSSHRQEVNIVDKEWEVSPRQEVNIVDEEQDVSPGQEDNIVDEHEMIASPRSAGCAEALHNNAPRNLASQNALGADNAASEPLQENNPTTIGNMSNVEADRTEPSSDDLNQFVLKRRAAAPKTSIEKLKEPLPEMCIPIEPSRKENNKKLRSNANLLDDQSESESYFMGSQRPFSEQNQCLICNEGGRLLTCSRKGCDIAVHESCILTTPSSFGKEGRFYCPCCAFTRASRVRARAQKVFSLARESLSSFLEMQKNQNLEEGEKGKQPVEKNTNGKRKGKQAEFSDDDTNDDEDGDATLVGFPGNASSSCELASRDSRRRVKNDGKRKVKHVNSNDRDVSDSDMHHEKGQEAKKHKADLAFAQLNKYKYVKSGPGATSGSHKAVLINEEAGNERREDRAEEAGNKRREDRAEEAGNERREDKAEEAGNKRREDRVGAGVNTRRRRLTPRYSNKLIAPGRRNMLPWTAEEEQALREGMQKFGIAPDGRIPWSTILEYRRSVFHKTRLPSDLKDKWRNMMKKEGSMPA